MAELHEMLAAKGGLPWLADFGYMTPIQIEQEVQRQVRAMRRNSQIPRAVEFGRAQVETLAAAGKSVLGFLTHETVCDAPSFHAVGSGEPYSRSEARRLELTIVRSDADDLVRVVD